MAMQGQKYGRNNVARVTGTIFGDANVAEALAINRNAEILKEALDRIEALEEECQSLTSRIKEAEGLV